jgi:hypothetical protein
MTQKIGQLSAINFKRNTNKRRSSSEDQQRISNYAVYVLYHSKFMIWSHYSYKSLLWYRLQVSLCYILLYYRYYRSRGSSVGIATRYGLEGPEIESLWDEIFRTYPDRLRGPPSLLYSGYRVFPGGKGGRSVILTTHPLLVPRLRKSWVIPLLTLWVLLGLLRGSL